MTAVGAARYAGSRVQRVEDARLLTGAGTFVDDVTRPGMLHACFVRSPHPRARILSDRRVRPRWRCPACTPSSPPTTSTATWSRPGTPGRGTWSPTRPGRRSPTARPGSPATRGPRRGGQPLPRRGRRRAGRRGLRAAAGGRRLRAPPGRRKRSCTRATPATSRASSPARPPRRSPTPTTRAAHVVSETIWEQAQARRPDGDPRPGRGVVARAAAS